MAVLKSVTIKYKKTRDMTAKKVILILIFIMSICNFFYNTKLTVKIIWLGIDPYLFNGRIQRILERMLNELTFSITYSIYATILYIWYSLTERIFKRQYTKDAGNEREDSAFNLVVKRYFEKSNSVLKNKDFPKIILYFKHVKFTLSS